MVSSPASSGAPATVWVVAGAPGVGKSTVAQALLVAVRPPPALLDKDTLFADLAGEVLAAHGRPSGEREGPWYDEHVKRHEYTALARAAREIRGSGCPVLLVAPFTEQIRDPDRWRQWVDRLGGQPVVLVWVGCDPGTLHARLIGRGRSRDSGKLDDFDAFARRTRPDTPPPVRHHAVWTSVGAEPVGSQVVRIGTSA
jgi:predicted kinase